MSSPPYYPGPPYYAPYSGEDWYGPAAMYELRKGPLEGGYGGEVDETPAALAPVVCRRSRNAALAGRVKGEELCVVCGDKACICVCAGVFKF